METLVDSSVLVGAANSQDSLHARAVRALSECTPPIVVHEYVILECAAVLMTRADKQTADTFVKGVLQNKAIRVMWSSVPVFLSATEEFLSTKAKISLVDSTLLALSSEYKVLTFDEALNRAIKRKSL
jgi:predicted nucleic acid-binding protein